MSPETKKAVKNFMEEVLSLTNAMKSWEVDQFTIMRIALINSIADQIYHHLEV